MKPIYLLGSIYYSVNSLNVYTILPVIMSKNNKSYLFEQDQVIVLNYDKSIHMIFHSTIANNMLKLRLRWGSSFLSFSEETFLKCNGNLYHKLLYFYRCVDFENRRKTRLYRKMRIQKIYVQVPVTCRI